MEDAFSLFLRRTAAIRDGLLEDATTLSEAIGLPYPVAFSRGVWSNFVRGGPEDEADLERAKASNILDALKRSLPPCFGQTPKIEVLTFRFIRADAPSHGKPVALAAICEHHDDASGFIALNLPEDIRPFLYRGTLARFRGRVPGEASS